MASNIRGAGSPGQTNRMKRKKKKRELNRNAFLFS
jgi:hypothetical protein